jgi:hypothetical protein
MDPAIPLLKWSRPRLKFKHRLRCARCAEKQYRPLKKEDSICHACHMEVGTTWKSGCASGRRWGNRGSGSKRAFLPRGEGLARRLSQR